MATTRGSLSVTVPNGSVLDFTPASCNIGSFTAFVMSPSAALPGLPTFGHRMLFRIQVGTAAWTSDVGIGSYPNGSLGIVTSAGDPKPVVMPGIARDFRLAPLGGNVVLNAIFYEGGQIEV